MTIITGKPLLNARRAIEAFLNTVNAIEIATPTSMVLKGADGCTGVLSSPEATAAVTQAADLNIKSFDGAFLLFRRTGNRLNRKYAGNPRFRHATRDGAEAEAQRLLTIMPDSSFVILQEVAVVKAAGEVMS
jgi:hypothetical protein